MEEIAVKAIENLADELRVVFFSQEEGQYWLKQLFI